MDTLIAKLKARMEQFQDLNTDTKQLWGMMTPQHMVEHLGGIIYGTANGKGQNVILPAEEAAKWKSRFFSAYYPFPRNIKMAGTQDQPVTLSELRYESLDEAKQKLYGAISLFVENLKANPDQTAGHGYFGELTMTEWLAFHIKHLEHHLMQFGLRGHDAKISDMEKMLYKLGKQITPDAPAQFGQMNAQQMVEHLGMVFLLSTGKFDFPYKGTEEDARKYWDGFEASDWPWKEVFPQTSYGDPRPPRNESIGASIAELRKTFQKYLHYSEENPDAIHPHFYLGNLSVDQWRQVHVKHIRHHASQFGLEL